jgi:TPR repeat protein
MIFVSGRAGGFIRAGRIPARSVSEPGLIHGLYRGRIAMNRTFKVAVAALMLAVSFAGSVAAGRFEDAAVAYKKGNYATALRVMRPLAEQGLAQAQLNLGLMYAKGQGVPQDYAAAVGWFRKAAEQGQSVRQDYAVAVS